MYEVNVTFKQPTNAKDLSLIASILRILETNEELRTGSELFYNTSLLVNQHHIISASEERITRQTMPYEEFVRLIKLGMEATLTLTVETEDGEESAERQLLPVTLIEMPVAKTAAVFLNYVPDFIPNVIGPAGPEITFTGELHELFIRDVNYGQK